MTPDEQYEIDERAAIMEFDGGLPLEEADRKARAALADPQGDLFDVRPPQTRKRINELATSD
jgi:hypothetical protein